MSYHFVTDFVGTALVRINLHHFQWGPIHRQPHHDVDKGLVVALKEGSHVRLRLPLDEVIGATGIDSLDQDRCRRIQPDHSVENMGPLLKFLLPPGLQQGLLSQWGAEHLERSEHVERPMVQKKPVAGLRLAPQETVPTIQVEHPLDLPPAERLGTQGTLQDDRQQGGTIFQGERHVAESAQLRERGAHIPIRALDQGIYQR